MKHLQRVFIATVWMLGIAFMVYALWAGSDAILSALAKPDAWSTLAKAEIAYILSGAAVGAGWFLLLRALSVGTSIGLAMAIVLLGQAPKYIPGNVAHLVGRIVLGQRSGIAAPKGAAILGVEIAAMAGVSFLAALYLVPQLVLTHDLYRATAAGVLALFVLAGLGWLFWMKEPRWSWHHRARSHIGQGLGAARDLARWRNLPLLLAYVCLVAAAFLFLGFFLRETVRAIDPPSLGSLGLLQATACFAAAWVVGFLTPGAPAGIGVRELTLVVVLEPFIGREVALAAAALTRILSVVGDVISTLIGAALYVCVSPQAGALRSDLAKAPSPLSPPPIVSSEESFRG